MSEKKPRTRIWIVILGFGVAFVASRVLVGTDLGDHAPRPVTPTVVARPTTQQVVDDGYRGLLANVNIGAKVYLKTDKTLIGEIVDVKRNHQFPDASVRDAVRIKYANGGSDWIPRETAIRIYVTR